MKPMTMLTVVALALGSASCVPDVQSVQIKYAMGGAIDSSCTVSSTTTQLFGGGVDPDWTNQYWLALYVDSNMEPDEWTSGGSTVHSGSRNDFYLTEATVTYAGLTLPGGQQPVSATVLAGGSLNFAMNVLSPDSHEVLKASIGKSVTVEVALRGKFAHGGEYETAPFSFPLSVYSFGSAPPDCAGQTKTALGGDGEPPCSNWGQDGYHYSCASDSSP